MAKIFWLVGESSGDLHASMLMQRINQDILGVKHFGIGGMKMQALGLKPLFPFERFAVMGFAEVIRHLPFFLKVESSIKQSLERERPDLVILVDYPGLNLRIAKIADDLKIPVLYYICPQFWAWKHKRVYKLKETVRHVACILPFEKELLDIHNVPCSYVGHPIAEEISFELDRQSFAVFFGLDPSKKWLGFFPGSRNAEIKRMLPIYLETAKAFDPQEYEILFSKARSVSHHQYTDILHTHAGVKPHIIDGYTYEMMKYCELLTVTSGTATLEAAFIGTPLIIAYQTSRLSYAIGKRLVRVKRIGLPNIVLDKDLLPEMVQDQLSPQRLATKIRSLLDDSERYQYIREELRRIHQILGERKASIQAMKIVRKLLRIDE